MSDQPSFTIYELYQMNGYRFPFWVTNDRPRHHAAKVIAFGRLSVVSKNGWGDEPVVNQENVDHPSSLFRCELYTLDKEVLIKKKVNIPAHNVKCWIPA